jgi:hypothetical protein
LDRGRLIGIWEYDTFAGEIVSYVWGDMTQELKGELARMETFVREELGDARSFSLDSPESRKPMIEALRAKATAAV